MISDSSKNWFRRKTRTKLKFTFIDILAKSTSPMNGQSVQYPESFQIKIKLPILADLQIHHNGGSCATGEQK